MKITAPIQIPLAFLSTPGLRLRMLAAIGATAVCMSANAGALQAPPLGTSLPARFTVLDSKRFKVEVLAPAAADANAPWGDIAAALKGCTVEGSNPATVGNRIFFQFSSLTCAGKEAIRVKAIGVSPVDHVNGVPAGAGVGALVTVLMLDSPRGN